MNIFDVILVQPIFNVLVLIYGLLPGHDFGVSLILFTILVRLALWPLVKKQLHQTKVVRQIQPELAKIKLRAKGNRQLEAQMMMELYRERGINPFSSIGTLLLQLPIFIALFATVNLITQDHANIAKFTYDVFEDIPVLQQAIAGNFNETLLGLVDLTRHATEAGGGIYWPLLIMAILAAGLQYVQSKQLLPKPKEKRRLRDMLKDQAAGKQVDQAEMSALMTNKMIWLFPVLTFFVSIYLAGALVLYLIANSVVAIIQQYFALKEDVVDMEKLSNKTQQRVQKAKPAEVVATPQKTDQANKKGGAKKKRR